MEKTAFPCLVGYHLPGLEQWDERGGGGRRWWKQWPKRESYDVSQGTKDAALWDGDIRKFTNSSFDGYFKDIRAIAIRAIPKNNEVSLSINDGDNTDRSDMTLALTPKSSVTLQKFQRYLTESFEPDLNSPKSIGKYRYAPPSNDSKLLSLKSERDYDIPKKLSGCTRVEKFLVGTSVYLAVAVLIMLIVIGAMVVSLKDINSSISNINVDESNRAGVQTQQPISTPTTTTSTATTTSPTSTTAILTTTFTTSTITTTTQTTTPPTTTTSTQTTPTTTTPIPTTTPRTTTTSKWTTPTTTMTTATKTTPTTTSTTTPTTTTTTTPTTPTTTTPTTTTTTTPTMTTTTSTQTTPTTTLTTTTTPIPTTTTTMIPTTTTKTSTQTPTTTMTTITTPSPTSTTTTSTKPQTTSTISTTSVPTSTTTVSATSNKVCNTNFCSSLAYNMKEFINRTVDACSDFYEFACGKWITYRDNAIQAGAINSWQRSTEEDDKINFYLKIKDVLEMPVSVDDSQFSKTLKHIYHSCLDEDSVFDDQKVTTEMRIALTPLGFDSKLSTTKSLEELQYMAMFNFGAFPLFRYDILPTENGDQTTQTLTLSPPSLFLKREVYDSSIDQSVIALDYIHRVSTLLESLYQNGSGGQIFKRDTSYTMRKLRQYDDYSDYGTDQSVYTIARGKMLNVFNLERQLHQIIPIKMDSSSMLSFSFGELKVRYPSMNWAVMFPSVSSNSTVIVRNTNFFYGMDRIVAQADADIVKVYELVTTILQGIWKYLPYAKRIYMNTLSGTKTERYDWLSCVNITFNLLNDELHREYAVKMSYDIGKSIDDVKSIISNITKVISVNINNSTQLSVETKYQLQYRLSTLRIKTIPISTINPDFSINPSFSLLFSAKECLRKRYTDHFAKVGTLVTSEVTQWFDMQSKYDEKSHIIELPLGLTSRIVVKDPIFPVLTTIGWEVATNIINTLYGSMSTPVSRSWWSTSSATQFLNTWTCFENQLLNSVDTDNSLNIGEIMTGNGALLLTVQDFQRQLLLGDTQRYTLALLSDTSEQIFILHFAQKFCEVPYNDAIDTNKIRVNSILRNSDFFQQAYQCPSDRFMNPQKKCYLF